MQPIANYITPEEAKDIGIMEWTSWDCECSVFDWVYTSEESSYFIEGDVTVVYEGGSLHITPGMLVTFPKDLVCTWHVDVPVKKLLKFV